MAYRGFVVFVWITEVLIRYFWTCLPQAGYVYPDEFFQATEITAGDIFGFKHTRTWEWSEVFPLRSPAFPYAVSGLPFYILKSLNLPEAITSRTLVVAPRLVMTTASLIIDIIVFKICKRLHMDPCPSLVILGSSFVTLVFNTRTFSNGAETILFASLLLLVISSMAKRDIILHSKLDSARYFFMGFLIGMGVWTRPTFVAFICVPVLWWLLDICFNKWTVEKNIAKLVHFVLKQCSILACGGVAPIIILTLVDSYYFGYFQQGQVVLTPLNFILYNLDTSALRKHGLHSRVTHFAINLPLLFGPIALCFYAVIVNVVLRKSCMSYVKALFGARNVKKDEQTDYYYKESFIWSLLFCSIIVPVSLLSFIPHQEPRFISPVLVPLVILFPQWLSKSSTLTLLAVLSWFIWNIFGCIVFGVMHQGGMYTCLAYLAQYLNNAGSLQTSAVEFHVTFHHTYMPPQHLLAWPSSHKNDINFHHTLALYDLKGSSSDVLMDHLQKLIKKLESSDRKYEVLVICPSTMRFQHPSLKLKKQFYPHLSMEDPPDLKLLFQINKTLLCTSGDAKERYHGSALGLEYCVKQRSNDVTNGWRIPDMEHVREWIKSDLSLNLYQYGK
ncbi:GPI mannosyltransferase 4-like [Montipora foliosa]|uniref:GPI mannosyltransferase 4-like n=1 Tax=Montipora foliosa TaxID=591990 RepID=UPI0035F14C1D